MREGGPSDERQEPIINNIKEASLYDRKLLGSGTEGTVFADVHGSPEAKDSYAHKEIASEQEAKRAYGIYSKMKDAGLPVVSFLKTHYYSPTDSAKRVGLLMEDVTENGKYNVVPIDDGVGHWARDELRQVDNLSKLQERMVRALAVLNNIGISHSIKHWGISIFLKINPMNPKEADFLFLDYTNFVDQPSDIEYQAEENFMALLDAIDFEGEERYRLTRIYREMREQKITHYEAA